MNFDIKPTADVTTEWTRTAAPHWNKLDEGYSPDIYYVLGDEDDALSTEAYTVGPISTGIHLMTKVDTKVYGKKDASVNALDTRIFIENGYESGGSLNFGTTYSWITVEKSGWWRQPFYDGATPSRTGFRVYVYSYTIDSEGDFGIGTIVCSCTGYARTMHMMEWLVGLGIPTAAVVNVFNTMSPHLCKLTENDAFDYMKKWVKNTWNCLSGKGVHLLRDVVHDDYEMGLL